MKRIYLIADLSYNEEKLLCALEKTLPYPEIYALQLWNFAEDKKEIILKIKEICHRNKIPIWINEDWKTALEFQFFGVHFDEIPENFEEIKSQIGNLKIGFTVGNDLEKIKNAEDYGAIYISFCSMFPSVTANSCEFVSVQSVVESRTVFSGKIFLAGGITPQTLPQLKPLPYDGIALVSGILGAEQPEFALKEYLKLINT